MSELIIQLKITKNALHDRCRLFCAFVDWSLHVHLLDILHELCFAITLFDHGQEDPDAGVRDLLYKCQSSLYS